MIPTLARHAASGLLRAARGDGARAAAVAPPALALLDQRHAEARARGHEERRAVRGVQHFRSRVLLRGVSKYSNKSSQPWKRAVQW